MKSQTLRKAVRITKNKLPHKKSIFIEGKEIGNPFTKLKKLSNEKFIYNFTADFLL